MGQTKKRCSNGLWVGVFAVLAFCAAFTISYLLVTDGRKHANKPVGHPGNEVVINDAFLRKLLPDHPEATIFRTEYLDFFTAEQPEERHVAEENGNKYVLKGDFNKNGKPEFAITGLLSMKPVNGKYQAFLVIIEQDGNDFRRLFYFTMQKSVRPDPDVEEIKNLALSSERPREITVTFANQSGFFMNVIWNGSKYIIPEESEGEDDLYLP
jgi:hypothetical protein